VARPSELPHPGHQSHQGPLQGRRSWVAGSQRLVPAFDNCRFRRYHAIAKSYKVLTLYNMNMRNTKVYSITTQIVTARQLLELVGA